MLKINLLRLFILLAKDKEEYQDNGMAVLEEHSARKGRGKELIIL